jgi:hypothetical protein
MFRILLKFNKKPQLQKLNNIRGYLKFRCSLINNWYNILIYRYVLVYEFLKIKTSLKSIKEV